MTYREERNYRVEIVLSAEFGEDYEGEEDGYAWHARFDRVVRPRVVRAVLEALASDPGWRVVPASRGANASDAFEVRVERVVASAETGDVS
jgi:hypothetical protein